MEDSDRRGEEAVLGEGKGAQGRVQQEKGRAGSCWARRTSREEAEEGECAVLLTFAVSTHTRYT